MRRFLTALIVLALWAGPAWGASVIASSKNKVNANAQTTGITVTHGFTLQNDDVLYAFLGQGDEIGTNWVSSSGGTWTQLLFQATAAGNDHASGVMRRVVTDAGGEPSTYTFTLNGNNAFDNLVAIVVQVRGANVSGTPEDATTTGSQGSDDFTPDNVDITTNTDNALVLVAHLAAGLVGTQEYHAGGAGGGARTAGAPSGYTIVNSEFYSDGSTNQPIFMEIAVDEDVGTAGAQMIGSWTGSPDEGSSEYDTYAVAVKPATAVSARPITPIIF